MDMITVKQCRVGEYVRFTENGPVWIRGEYDRSEKRYWLYRFDDVNSGKFVAGARQVFVGFTF